MEGIRNLYKVINPCFIPLTLFIKKHNISYKTIQNLMTLKELGI